jgi:RsiW-degrading membrane proteinase PrsW (M82 family)
VSVIDPKAILSGQSRRGVPIGAIVTIAISSVCLAVFLGLALILGQASFLVAAILSMVTLVPMMAGVLALDRLEPEPKFLLVTTFLWGAGASVAMSLIFEGIGVAVLYTGIGDAADAAGTVIVAPVVEEIAKALVLFGLFWFRRGEINGITDGVVYAATTALGFAAAENILYYISAASESLGSMFSLFIVRGVLSPFCHPVFTAMTGIGLALAASRHGVPRFFLPLGGLILAILLHAMWNGSTFFGLGALGIAFLVMIGVLVGILLAVRAERKNTVARIQNCMVQYTSTGLVTNSDLIMLSTLTQRKYARQWAKSVHGKSGFAAMRDYQQACTELTLLHDRATDSTVTPEFFYSRQQALLGLMHLARQAFLGPRYMWVPMAQSPTAHNLSTPPVSTHVPPAHPSYLPTPPVQPTHPGHPVQPHQPHTPIQEPGSSTSSWAIPQPWQTPNP